MLKFFFPSFSIQRIFRACISLFVIAVAGVFSILGCKPSQDKVQSLDIGGDFQLISEDNPNWKLSKNSKDVNLIFFGYTSCPDFCPTTLAKFKKLNQILGTKKSTVQYIFISLDEKRDTPGSVKKYVNFYVDNGIGLTGDRNAITEVLRLFNVSYKMNGDFIDHSTYTYLVDKNLKTRYLFKHTDTPEKILEIINIIL